MNARKIFAAAKLFATDRQFQIMALGMIVGTWLSLEAFAWLMNTTLVDFAAWWALCMIPSLVLTWVAWKVDALMHPAFVIGVSALWALVYGDQWGVPGWIFGALFLAAQTAATIAINRR